jgi:hypothetical protein
MNEPIMRVAVNSQVVTNPLNVLMVIAMTSCRGCDFAKPCLRLNAHHYFCVTLVKLIYLLSLVLKHTATEDDVKSLIAKAYSEIG